MMHFYRILSLMLVLLVLAGCQGLSSEPQIVATIPPSNPVESVTGDRSQQDIAAVMTLGSQVWQESCVRCHGPMGQGTAEGAPLPDLTSYTDEQILASITNGVRDVMPAFGDELSAEQLNAAMTFAKMMSLAIARDMVQVAPTEAAPAAAPTAGVEVAGVVAGQVANGTAGAALPAALTLTLHVIKSEISEASFETPLNADGSYRFENVPFSANYQYVVTAPYGDVMFVSEIAAVDTAQPTLALPITIYEMGADNSAIQIDGLTAQGVVQSDRLRVVEIVRFVNTGDRVYLRNDADGFRSVGLRLPANATLESTMDENVIADGTQVFDTRPVLPGASRLMHVAYSLPYTSGSVIEQRFDYPVAGRVDVLLANTDLSLSGEGLSDMGMVTSGGRSLLDFGGEVTLAAGDALRFTVSGVPNSAAAAAAANTLNPVALLLIGAGVGALLVAGGLMLRERMRSRKLTVGDLLEEIANLDSQHSAGSVNEQVYTRQRAALKAQLTTLMKQQN